MMRRLLEIGLLTVASGVASSAWAQAAEEPTALDRYQSCFQKMIDTGAADNAFMRRCLGIEDKPARSATGTRPGAAGEVDHLTRGDALEVAERGLAGIKECYGILLGATKDLGVTPEGTIDVRMTVRTAGDVADVKFAPGSLTDVALLGCVRDKLKAWAFPKTAMVEPVAVTLGLRLFTSGKRQPSTTLTKGSPKVSGPGYGLSQEDLLSVFRKNVPSVRQCYDEQLKRVPAASGNVGVDLTVNARGRVAKVLFRELTVGDEAFKGCVATAVRKWKFPKPRGGEPTLVRYPAFQFAPK